MRGKKRGDILGTSIKVSVEKENETAGKTNKAHKLWVVPEPRSISSLILILAGHCREQTKAQEIALKISFRIAV